MKKVLLAVCAGVMFVSPAVSANEIRSIISDSVQLSVEGPSLTSTRVGSSYSVSGTNINVTTMGGITGGSATAPATLIDGSYAINTNGQAYSFSETGSIGDTVVTDQTDHDAAGRWSEPVLYGVSTTYAGGTSDDLAGTLSSTGIPTVTAGGPGSSALGQRTVTLSVFD